MITKKNSNTFVKEAIKMLVGLGAVEQEPYKCMKDIQHEFKLQTKIGELNISLRKEQSHLYTIFSVFLDDKAVEKAKELLGHWKYNCMFNYEHNTPSRAVEFAKCHFEAVL